MSALSRLARLCFLGYVVLAVLYTTNFYLLSPLLALSHSALSSSVSPWSQFSVSFEDKPLEVASKLGSSRETGLSLPVDFSDALWPEDISSSAEPFIFPISELVHRLGMDHATRTSIHEATLLSKAFAGALHPTRVIPFYYRATGSAGADDVTITTLVTRNRFKVFRQLVERYRGPISVRCTYPFPLQRLHALYMSSPLFSMYVDVHLALSPFAALRTVGEGEGGRQFNVWRNVARLFARTEFIMMLDVDFAKLSRGDVMQRLREGRAALVVPAFEYTNLADGVDQRTFPTDKESLLRLAQADPPKIAAFHAIGEVFRVAQYQSAYEPYVIVSKRVSWCDERFTGYGANKAACLFEMYLSGVSFYVMADHFVIHQTHTYEEAARREEVRTLHMPSRTYLFRYAHEGVLHTPRGFNVQEECKKLKGVARIAAQVRHAVR
ncbi:uncharacterized protein B0H18DRAFT_1087043 [Fomitopsis serialis]|uniref:uncharacterized protein n=1 Tax=Fomitopsis serialis TaxID=139415 RepID=UPI0020084ACD|nr:uncharacterized protein B0H18DRAFT_1087043 [Neoantrodia serialis]KAH9917541.1 hypothetical protein B0H18DRAFT_1087043 [Neoantrodia serialis]